MAQIKVEITGEGYHVLIEAEQELVQILAKMMMHAGMTPEFVNNLSSVTSKENKN